MRGRGRHLRPPDGPAECPHVAALLTALLPLRLVLRRTFRVLLRQVIRVQAEPGQEPLPLPVWNPGVLTRGVADLDLEIVFSLVVFLELPFELGALLRRQAGHQVPASSAGSAGFSAAAAASFSAASAAFAFSASS